MVPGAREALLALSTKYRLVLITGRVEVHPWTASEA